MTRTYAVAFLICCFITAGGCDIISPAPESPTPGASAAVLMPATPTPSATPNTTSRTQPSPAVSPATLPSFVTPLPVGPGKAWSGITWRKLAADDPLAEVRSMLRWRGGYVAVGATIPTGDTSNTPVWVSDDGGTWRQLDTAVLGPAAVVLGVRPTPTGLVALTLQGGKNRCDGAEERLTCWTLNEPLQSWTSSDGVSWTAHPGPEISLVDADGVCCDPPILEAGVPGLVVFDWEPTGFRAATSRDGIAWEVQQTGPFSTQFGFYRDSVVAFGSGFLAVGEESAGDTVRAVAMTSSNGSQWASQRLPRTGFAPGWIPRGLGTSAGQLVAGSAGLIAIGGIASAPGAGLWWSSLDGRTWRPLPKFPPLGIWFGDSVGNGTQPNGTVVGNGERMLAYRSEGNDAAWTSFNGRSWRPLAISGARPPSDQGVAAILLPVGLMWIGSDGSTWLGEPVR